MAWVPSREGTAARARTPRRAGRRERILAEEEVRQLGERISEVIRHSQDNGWHHVGRPRWGYRWREATEEERRAGAPKRVLEAHPDEAPYAAEAWRRVAAGETLRSVYRWVAGLPESARGTRSLRR